MQAIVIRSLSGETVATISTYDELKSFYSNHVLGVTNTSSDDERIHYLEQLMRADANAQGYSITEYTGTTIPDAQSNTRRMVALVVTEHEFHYYMQHTDNTWSHKQGSLQPTNLCLDHGTALTNANIRAHANESVYTGGALKFYYITKDAVIDYMHYNGRGQCTQTAVLLTDRAGNCEEAAKDIGTAPRSDISGAYDYIGDVDYYLFRTNASGQYSFTSSTPNTAYTLTAVLYDDQGNVLQQVQSTSGAISFTYTLSGNTPYYVSFSSTIINLHGFGRNYLFSISSS